MYPNWPEVLDGIPSCDDVKSVKLRKGGTIITDGCSTARKHCKLLCELTVDMSKELHIPGNKISIFEGDCWQHMRNVWFGAVIKHMSTWLKMRLAEDLEKIPKVYGVSTNFDNLLQCIVKGSWKTHKLS